MAGRPKQKVSMSQRMAEVAWRGQEPQNLHIDSDLSICKALNWYAAYGERDTAFQYLRDYMKAKNFPKREIDSIATSTVDWIDGMSLGHRAHMMLSRNCTFSEVHMNRFNEKLAAVIEKATKRMDAIREEARNKIVRLPAFSKRDQDYEDLGEVEAQLDFFLENWASDFNAYNWFRKQETSPAAVRMLIERYERIIREIEANLEEVRPMPSAKRKLYVRFLQKVITDSNSYLGAKTAQKTIKVRKPRKAKVKSAEQLASKVKYQHESKEFKLVSISPASIIGAQQFWCFHTRSRNLFVYVANNEKGLQLKGTKLENVDMKNSMMKTLRKPEEMLPDVCKLHKTALMRKFKEIRTKERKGNMRLDDQMILLRAIK